jgi:hypothetical protein
MSLIYEWITSFHLRIDRDSRLGTLPNLLIIAYLAALTMITMCLNVFF